VLKKRKIPGKVLVLRLLRLKRLGSLEQQIRVHIHPSYVMVKTGMCSPAWEKEMERLGIKKDITGYEV
jgi:hypothetical protein